MNDGALKNRLARTRHDLYSPLGQIIGYSELLLEGNQDREEQAADLERILVAARNLLGRLEAFFDELRVEGDHLEWRSPASDEATTGKPAARAGAAESMPRAEVTLPAPLLASMREAAQAHRVTRLKKHLVQAEAINQSGRHLAAQLRELMQQYDMEAIALILKGTRHE